MFEQIYEGEGSLRVCLEAHVSSNGAILYLSGGDLPHIGGVAVGVPRPRNASRLTANVSVISILGHKDDELARPIADKVARRTGQLAVVIAGIHVENATAQDLDSVVRNAHAAVDAWLERLRTAQQAR
jgi:gallate decarboxylase subunit D